MRYFKKVEGDNIFLSPLNMDDYEIYTQWINDLSTSVYLGNSSSLYSMYSEREALEGMVKSGYHFAIILKNGEKLLGNCSLFDLKPVHRSAELGIFIGAAEYRGKGYGTEALELLVGYGFRILNLNNIMLKVFPFNARAIRSYQKAGFRQFGRRTQAFFLNGRYFDEIFMEVLAKDFQSKYFNFDHLLGTNG